MAPMASTSPIPAPSGILVTPIGHVVGGRSEVRDDSWDTARSRIVLDPAQVEAEATLGLVDFSHLEVVFLFDRVDPASVCRGARHPRGRSDWPRVGILAQRAKDRPNRIGATVCRLLRAEGHTIEVAALDAVDGTPVLDVKPYFSGFAPRDPVREPPWVRELMSGYW